MLYDTQELMQNFANLPPELQENIFNQLPDNALLAFLEPGARTEQRRGQSGSDFYKQVYRRIFQGQSDQAMWIQAVLLSARVQDLAASNPTFLMQSYCYLFGNAAFAPPIPRPLSFLRNDQNFIEKTLFEHMQSKPLDLHYNLRAALFLNARGAIGNKRNIDIILKSIFSMGNTDFHIDLMRSIFLFLSPTEREIASNKLAMSAYTSYSSFFSFPSYSLLCQFLSPSQIPLYFSRLKEHLTKDVFYKEEASFYLYGILKRLSHDQVNELYQILTTLVQDKDRMSKHDGRMAQRIILCITTLIPRLTGEQASSVLNFFIANKDLFASLVHEEILHLFSAISEKLDDSEVGRLMPIFLPYVKNSLLEVRVAAIQGIQKMSSRLDKSSLSRLIPSSTNDFKSNRSDTITWLWISMPHLLTQTEISNTTHLIAALLGQPKTPKEYKTATILFCNDFLDYLDDENKADFFKMFIKLGVDYYPRKAQDKIHQFLKKLLPVVTDECISQTLSLFLGYVVNQGANLNMKSIFEIIGILLPRLSNVQRKELFNELSFMDYPLLASLRCTLALHADPRSLERLGNTNGRQVNEWEKTIIHLIRDCHQTLALKYLPEEDKLLPRFSGPT